MLNVERVRALCSVAEHGSVAEAARQLHVTASGVSQQLAKLEREVGVELLTQAGRGVQLTEAGRVLAQRGQQILALIATSEAEIASLGVDVAGELRIGSFSSATRSVIPRALAVLRERHSRLEVSFVAGDAEDLLRDIERRHLDVALVDSWVTLPLRLPEGTRHTLVHEDVADVALPADHPESGSETVDLTNLADMPWTTWRKGESFHLWLVQTLRTRGVEPLIRYEVPEFAAQLEFVASGLAASLLPRLARVHVPENVAIRAVDPPLRREIYALWRADNSRPSIEAAVQALREVFEQTPARVPRT
ncbi:LysR family transcriptional regulator [Rhodococcus sp. 1R11]|uniref:LysR family transcriptional regulator n=1 Tax=Rhodococcus ruber TaxID=1830 RepID=A0ABT4MRB7_9NOCA|nr:MULTISPECIES: LysR family transcriptional regulator [Rhodococcus]MCZ4522271.1 LysR family transcriptional regulator [Rhodococcus ruber]MDI9933778.1 LysR family transcriptional regulator [Rhodococcus sp. IEGM 1354]TFI40228.1 LysR family transcriptional regulator [Rhodococcus sp. 1R11]